MPRIEEFNVSPQQSQIHASEEGPSALARMGREEQLTGETAGRYISQGVGQLGRAAGEIDQQYQNHVTTQDIVNGAQQHTALDAKAATELPQILANSDNPVQAMQDYYEKTYQPASQKIADGMNTDQAKRWAAEHQASSSQAFFQHGMAEAMNIQGARTVAQFDGMVDNLSTAAHANPQGYEMYIDQAGKTMDAVKAGLTPQQQTAFEEHRANIQSQIALTAGHSLADQNPAQFQKDLDGGWGAKYLTGEQRQQLHNYANYAQHQQDMDQRRASQDHITDWVNGLYGQDGRVQAITPEMIGKLNTDPSIRPQDRRAAIGLGVSLFKQQQASDEGLLNGRNIVHNDPATAADFITRIGDPNHPLTREEISKAVNENKLTVGTAMEFAGKLNPRSTDPIAKLNSNPIVKGEFDRAAQTISGPAAANLPNLAVKGKIDQFKLDTLRQLQDVVSKGGDVKPYLDPNSKEYLFSDERIKQYVPSKQEIATQMLQPKTPPAAPPSVTRPSLEAIFGGLGGK